MREPSMNFDTHKSIKFLVQKGMKEPQAESIVEIVSKSRDHNFSKLATKDQLNLVEEKLRGEIAEVKGKVLAIEGKVSAVEGKVSAVEGKILAVKEEIKSVEEKLRGEIISVKYDILKWMIPLLISILLTVLFKG